MPPAPTAPRTVGAVTLIDIESVEPNPWNPNRLDPSQYASLKHGIQHDGWVASQALLVWSTDKKGKRRMLIIDGEHRWKAARELGMTKVPAVLLERLGEAEAKALTIKLDAKRGEFEPTELGRLLREIQAARPGDDAGALGLDLGFDASAMARLLAPPPEAAGPNQVSQNPNVKTVPLFFTGATLEEFTGLVRELGAKHGTDNTTDVVMAAVRAVL